MRDGQLPSLFDFRKKERVDMKRLISLVLCLTLFAGLSGYAAGEEQESLPVKEEKKTRKVQKRTVFLIEAAPADPDTSSPGPAYALRKRPAQGLLANLWEFPGTDGHLTEDDARQHLESLGFEVHSLTGLPSARHIFSHVEWDMRGYLVHAEASAESAGLVYATKKEMEQLYSIPTAFRFYLSLLE